MSGQSTTIKNPETGENKVFSFDHSYWSHADYDESEQGIYVPSPQSNYSDQVSLKSDLE
jgi:hypothetical protein